MDKFFCDYRMVLTIFYSTYRSNIDAILPQSAYLFDFMPFLVQSTDQESILDG
jgi:hypothetical protein